MIAGSGTGIPATSPRWRRTVWTHDQHPFHIWERGSPLGDYRLVVRRAETGFDSFVEMLDGRSVEITTGLTWGDAWDAAETWARQHESVRPEQERSA